MENPEAPTPQRRRGVFLVFDTPFRSDWLCWLTALAVFAGARSTFADYGGGLAQGLSRSSQLALIVDLLIAVGFQIALFGLGIGAIRRAFRRRRGRERQPSGRGDRINLWPRFIGYVVLPPIFVAYGTASASRPAASAAEEQTCQAAQGAVDALGALAAATDRDEGLRAMDDAAKTLDLMAIYAHETDNDVIGSEAQLAQGAMVASFEAMISGNVNKARNLSEEGDPHFDAVAAECARLGLRLEEENADIGLGN